MWQALKSCCSNNKRTKPAPKERQDMHQKRRINNKQLCVSSNIVCVVSCLWLFTLYTNLIATEIKCDCYRNIFCILRNQIIAPAINLIAQSRQMISIAIKHDYNQNNNFRNFLCNAAHA
eukprot:512949_1